MQARTAVYYDASRLRTVFELAGNATVFKFGALVMTYGTAAPTTGTWADGDICFMTAPTATGVPGWVCTTAGSPGTWTEMTVLDHA